MHTPKTVLARSLALCLASGIAAASAAEPDKASAPGKAAAVVPGLPGMPAMAFPMPSKKDHPPNTMTETVSSEAKGKALQSMMMANPLSMREMMAMMVAKQKVQPGVSFDDAVASLKLRANKHNFKFVGHSPLSKDVEATTGKPSPRVEVFNFCDSMVARRMLDYAPELIAFLPCRIAILEDAKKDFWVVTLDWDIAWMQFSKNPNNMDEALMKEAAKVRAIIDDMMKAAATGDL